MNKSTQENSSAELGDALIRAFSLPEHVTKLVLTMEGCSPPIIECTYLAPREVEGDAASRFEEIAGKFALVPIGGTLAGTTLVGQ